MDVILLIMCLIVLFLLFTSYNHILATKALRRGSDRVRDSDMVDNVRSPQEMYVRAVKAYTLGDYIVITTVIQRGSSRKGISEVVVDEPSLLIPLANLSEDVNEYEDKSIPNNNS